MSPWRIEVRDPADPAALAAVVAYSAELDARFGESSPTITDPHLDDYRRPTGTFLVVVDESGDALGCAGLRTIETDAYGAVAEVKRMWVSPLLRGQGVGRALLERLHEEARVRGLTQVVLDSRRDLDDARRLYVGAGYADIDRYNANADATVWMRVDLGSGRRTYASVMLVDEHGAVLLQHRDAHAPRAPLLWGMVGGAVEAGEKPEEAAYRELREETGIELAPGALDLWSSDSFTWSDGSDADYRVFVAATSLTDADVVLGEGLAIVFVPAAEIASLPLTESGRHFILSFLASDSYRALLAR
jgi:8-oxo-dGTP pyrophosphatase MutT (NUDIX family)/GNAT superfamily N-acetyltransferase